jgi:hypothetical protein
LGLRFPHDAEVGGGPSHLVATSLWPVGKSFCIENQTATEPWQQFY